MANARPMYSLHVPNELKAGNYANQLAVWHSAHEFTIDFYATDLPQKRRNQAGEEVTVVPGHVTSRIKLPPTLMQTLLQAISQNLSGYEEKFGPIRQPGGTQAPVPLDDLLGNDPEGDNPADRDEA